MINKLIKKIWFICVWLASLTLVWCFHVPDEDRLLSSNKTETWNIKNDELDEAINSLIDWVNIVSSQRNETKNNENEEVYTWESEELDIEIKDENIDGENRITNEELSNNENDDQEIENIIPEE